MPIVNIPKGTPDWDIPINQNFETLQNEKVGLDSNGKIDKTLIPDDIGGLQNFQEEHTYAELAALIAEKKLVPGMQYVLMDYQTKYRQPYTNAIKTSTVEKLVLTAIDETYFAPECSSLSYPQDIVTYDFNMNKCEDNSTTRNGFITWRKSTNTSGNYAQISAPGDWRTIKYARYKPDPDNYLKDDVSTPFKTWSSGSYVTLGELYKYGNAIYKVIQAGIPTSATDGNHFSILYDNINTAFLPNDSSFKISFVGNTVLKLVKGAVAEYDMIAPNCYNINIDHFCNSTPIKFNTIFLSGCNDIHMGENCTDNTFGARVKKVNIGTNCTNNIFFSDSNNITIFTEGRSNLFFTFNTDIHLGGFCDNNLFDYRCAGISLGEYCYDNFFGTSCGYMSFGNACSANRIAPYNSDIHFDNRCKRNITELLVTNIHLGQSCNDNQFTGKTKIITMGQSCTNNNIQSCTYVRFADGCIKNTLGLDDHISFGPFCQENNIGSKCVGITLLNECTKNTFGDFSNYITCYAGTVGNTFGGEFNFIVVKNLYNKNLSNISALKNGGGTTTFTIESDNTGKFLYWYINSSGSLVRTLIP